jgi:hypothetical protein
MYPLIFAFQSESNLREIEKRSGATPTERDASRADTPLATEKESDYNGQKISGTDRDKYVRASETARLSRLANHTVGFKKPGGSKHVDGDEGFKQTGIYRGESSQGFAVEEYEVVFNDCRRFRRCSGSALIF